ncbi:MAG: hypothetical protein ACTS4V_00565 [Candidatus Hodgkinia cicadicola]
MISFLRRAFGNYLSLSLSPPHTQRGRGERSKRGKENEEEEREKRKERGKGYIWEEERKGRREKEKESGEKEEEDTEREKIIMPNVMAFLKPFDDSFRTFGRIGTHLPRPINVSEVNNRGAERSNSSVHRPSNRPKGFSTRWAFKGTD